MSKHWKTLNWNDNLMRKNTDFLRTNFVIATIFSSFIIVVKFHVFMLLSKSVWNEWNMNYTKFWIFRVNYCFCFWKNEEIFWRGQCCVEKTLNVLLFWYDQISSWRHRKKATSEIVKCTRKFCVPENISFDDFMLKTYFQYSVFLPLIYLSTIHPYHEISYKKLSYKDLCWQRVLYKKRKCHWKIYQDNYYTSQVFWRRQNVIENLFKTESILQNSLQDEWMYSEDLHRWGVFFKRPIKTENIVQKVYLRPTVLFKRLFKTENIM